MKITITLDVSAPLSPTHYRTNRIDMTLTDSESLIVARIREAMVQSGLPCRGNTQVLKHLLHLVKDAVPDSSRPPNTRSPGKSEELSAK